METRNIKLSKDKYAIVNAEDYNWLNQWKWCCSSAGYAVRSITIAKQNDGKRFRKQIFIHRLLLGVDSELQCDHINGNPLDNRRCNLRLATTSQNQANRPKFVEGTSKYKGVSWQTDRNKWFVQVKNKDNFHFVGRFVDENEAALAYNIKALELFGEYARLNVIY